MAKKKFYAWTITLRIRPHEDSIMLRFRNRFFAEKIKCYYLRNDVNVWICDDIEYHLWRKLPIEIMSLKDLKRYLREEHYIVRVKKGIPTGVQRMAEKYAWLFVSPFSWFRHKGKTLLWMPTKTATE